FLSVLMRVLGRLIHARTLEVQAQESQLAARVQESLSGIRIVQSYAQEASELRAFKQLSTRLIQSNLRLVRVWLAFFPSTGLGGEPWLAPAASASGASQPGADAGEIARPRARAAEAAFDAGGVAPPPMRGDIELAGVSFAYAPGRPVLHDIHLQVRAGETLV